MKRKAWGLMLVVLGVYLVVGAVAVFGFAEEDIGFRDPAGHYYPPTAPFPEERVSTIHDDLTLALAIAAGFSISDSHTLRIWDQLVDSEALPGHPRSYKLGNAGFYTPPDPTRACAGKNHARQVWPTASFDPQTSAVTSRFGPYSPFFHFPHLGGADLQALHDWAWGITNTLHGYEAYAWGRLTDFTLMQAVQHDGCIITRTVTISMPVSAGSLQAFGIYVHTLGDAYSHADCLAALEAFSPPAPWGTHTVPVLGDPDVYACNYNPSNPRNDDAHGREFGSVYTDTRRTIAAARAIYAALAERSVAREGIYPPLPLTTTLRVSGTETTLEEAITHVVTTWDYDQPARRRAYLDALVQALLSMSRAHPGEMYLPFVLRE